MRRFGNAADGGWRKRLFAVRHLSLVLPWLGCAHAAPLPALVGCPADGMMGPVAAAVAPPAAGAAARLALYAAPSLAVLAPRGWHCLELYGSGGAFLLVTPRRYTPDTLPGFNTLVGPAVELSFLSGENSGREQVAEVFARLFPFKRAAIRRVEEDEDHPRHLPAGPYASDRTTRRTRGEVDYTTPPYRHGMGTYASRLGSGADPIHGAAVLARSNGVDSVMLLNVRLPGSLRGSTAAILQSARHAQGFGDPRPPS